MRIFPRRMVSRSSRYSQSIFIRPCARQVELGNGRTNNSCKSSILKNPVISPDGKALGFLDYAQQKFELVVVDFTTGTEVHRVRRVLHPTFSPGGLLLMSFDNNRLRVWSLAELLAPAGKKEKLKK